MASSLICAAVVIAAGASVLLRRIGDADAPPLSAQLAARGAVASDATGVPLSSASPSSEDGELRDEFGGSGRGTASLSRGLSLSTYPLTGRASTASATAAPRPSSTGLTTSSASASLGSPIPSAGTGSFTTGLTSVATKGPSHGSTAVQSTTVQSTTVQPTTVQPATAHPTIVQSTTVQPTIGSSTTVPTASVTTASSVTTTTVLPSTVVVEGSHNVPNPQTNDPYVQQDFTGALLLGSYIGDRLCTASVGLAVPIIDDGPPLPQFAPDTVGVGDVNGDARSDIVTGLNSRRSVTVWFMSNERALTNQVVNGPGGNWRAQAVGDVNGDLRADIVWVDGSTNEVQFATVVGSTVTFVKAVMGLNNAPLAPPIDYKLIGTGDFDGDDRADLLWQASDRTLVVWFMRGAIVRGWAPIGKPPATQPIPTLIVDFNRDGRSDLLFNHVLWVMSSATAAISELYAPLIPDGHDASKMKLAAVCDLDADFRIDTIWSQMDDQGRVVERWVFPGVGPVRRLRVSEGGTSF